MSSWIMFILVAVSCLVLWGGISFYRKGVNPIKYLSEKRGIWSGIKFAFIFTVILSLFGALSGCSKGEYLKDGSVYMGLDVPMQTSPQCRSYSNEVDDKTTSNLGVRVNVYESGDNKFRTNAKYTHHSCAFNTDIRVYDALGIEFEYKLFQR